MISGSVNVMTRTLGHPSDTMPRHKRDTRVLDHPARRVASRQAQPVAEGAFDGAFDGSDGMWTALGRQGVR
ncbi:hypothetical protein GCM10023096_55910 [Nonomuraea ferruginea]